MTFSLHRARTPRSCDLCGRRVPPGGEYWRSKGRRSEHASWTFCVLCHVLFGLPTDGWTEPADGEATVTALRPV